MDETPERPVTIRHYRQLANEIIEKHFGKPPRRIVYKRSGRTNYVFAVNHIDGQFVVRISPDPNRIEAFKKELWATQKVREAGASDAEIKQAMTNAFSVRRSATDMMEAYGLARLGGNNPGSELGDGGTTDRVKELVCIGAAFGVNCVSSLKAHLEAAEKVGISHEDIGTLVKLSAFIKGKAGSHVERLAETLEKPEAAYEKAVSACC